MLQKGYNSGELIEDIDIDIPGHEPFSEDGYFCYGWFNVDRYNNKLPTTDEARLKNDQTNKPHRT